MALEHVASFELPATKLAGIGGGDATLVALMPHQRGLVKVGAPAARARVLVGQRVAGGVVGGCVVLAVLVHELHGAGEGGEGVVEEREHWTKTTATALACTQ